MFRLFRHYLSGQSLFLFGADCLLLFGIYYFISTTSLPLPTVPFHGLSGEAARGSGALFLSAAMGVVMWSTGLYDRSRLADISHSSKRLILAFIIGYPLVLSLAVLDDGRTISGFGQLPVYGASAIAASVGVLTFRFTFARVLNLVDTRRRILVIGVGPRAAHIEELVRQNRNHQFTVVGYVRVMNEETIVEPSHALSGIDSLADAVAHFRAQELVVAITNRRGFPLQSLLECRLLGIPVTDYLTFWERETGQVMLEALDPSWLVYSDGFRLGAASEFLKRLFDIMVSITFLILLAPLILAAAAAIRLDSPGSVLFVQERVGRNGRTFALYKFRSMYADAEASGVPRWAEVNDERVTRVGAFLRKTRIDELPQIFNVLKGDMSIVGPRPERPYFVQTLTKDIPFYNSRHYVRPGITGWAQINYPYGASVGDSRQKLSFDLYYIKNYSFLLDLLILLETVQAIIWPHGVR